MAQLTRQNRGPLFPSKKLAAFRNLSALRRRLGDLLDIRKTYTSGQSLWAAVESLPYGSLWARSWCGSVYCEVPHLE